MYALRNLRDPDNQQDIYKGKVYADFLTVQISDGIGTKNEQTAICAAVSLTNLKCIREEDPQDLGFGIFQLSKPRKIAIVPSFDPESLFQDLRLGGVRQQQQQKPPPWLLLASLLHLPLLAFYNTRTPLLFHYSSIPDASLVYAECGIRLR